MSNGLLLAACGILVASTLQSATGFGFALVAGPVFYLVAPPAAAVGLVLLLGQVLNLLILFGEQRRPQIDWSAAVPALLAAAPGLPVGALLVRTLPVAALQVGVGCIVCVLVAVRLHAILRPHPPSRRAMGTGAAVTAGFAVGVLSTSTTTNGPPLAIWLTARRMPPAAVRDLVSLIFLVLDVVGVGVLIAIVGADETLGSAGWLAWLVPVAVVGHLVGRRAFVRLPGRLYEPTVLGCALVAGLATTIAGLT